MFFDLVQLVQIFNLLFVELQLFCQHLDIENFLGELCGLAILLVLHFAFTNLAHLIFCHLLLFSIF